MSQTKKIPTLKEGEAIKTLKTLEFFLDNADKLEPEDVEKTKILSNEIKTYIKNKVNCRVKEKFRGVTPEEKETVILEAQLIKLKIELYKRGL